MFLSTEELAWRGFALPRLQARWGALVASLAIGLISAVWYVPVFFMKGPEALPQLPPFVVATIALSVVYAWVFNNTRGSILLCALAHAAVSTWTDIIPASPADQILSQWIYAALLVVVATIIVVVFGSERLSRRPASELPVVVDRPVRVARLPA
jgi:membrane protease YdiL (CAAX protease family)